MFFKLSSDLTLTLSTAKPPYILCFLNIIIRILEFKLTKLILNVTNKFLNGKISLLNF